MMLLCEINNSVMLFQIENEKRVAIYAHICNLLVMLQMKSTVIQLLKV